MTARRSYTRHGLTATMARVKLQGFTSIDRRTAGARAVLAFKRDLIAALGGDKDLSPQRARLVDLAARAALLLDHVDAWIFARESLINGRTKTLLPVVIQRQAIAEHLAKLLDRLGLDRVAQRVPSLSEYIEAQYGQRNGATAAATGAGATSRSDEATEVAAGDDRASQANVGPHTIFHANHSEEELSP